MALKDCIECGKPVSTGAAACPNCGAKTPAQTSAATWIIGGLLGASVLLAVVVRSLSPIDPAPAPMPPVAGSSSAYTVLPDPPPEQLIKYMKPEKQREWLANSLLETMQQENQHLNHLRTRVSKVKGGYQIMAVHDLFSKYTLSAGRNDQVLQTWIDKHAEACKVAGVSRVGVWGTGNYASGSWYDLKKL